MVDNVRQRSTYSVSWPIITAITFFSGVQLMTIWIISEYIGRIYDESKKRPQYIVDKKINIE
jgi:glycosyltransferase involved in cell wall biosynthesis